jgi:hypothetical protein
MRIAPAITLNPEQRATLEQHPLEMPLRPRRSLAWGLPAVLLLPRCGPSRLRRSSSCTTSAYTLPVTQTC